MPKGTPVTNRSKRTPPPPLVASARPDRDAKGKLLPGHKLKSPGNPHAQRIHEYREAIRGAVTGEDLCRVFEKLKRLALAGDMDAIRELLNRTLGKVRHLESSLAGVRLPDITNPRDVTRAANAIFHGLSEGTLTADDGAKLASIVELARRSIETHELAERLSALEKEVNCG